MYTKVPEFPVDGSISSLNIVDDEAALSDTEKPQKSTYDTFFGIIMMLLGVVQFALSTVFCKFAYMQNERLTGFDYLIVRSSTLVIAALLQASYLRVNIFDIKKEGRLWLFLR